MKEEKQAEVLRVFGWPDASWIRGWNIVKTRLMDKDEDGAVKSKLCRSIREAISEIRFDAMNLLQVGNYESAHGATNELLELGKMCSDTCENCMPSDEEQSSGRNRTSGAIVRERQAEQRAALPIIQVPAPAPAPPVEEAPVVTAPIRAAVTPKQEKKSLSTTIEKLITRTDRFNNEMKLFNSRQLAGDFGGREPLESAQAEKITKFLVGSRHWNMDPIQSEEQKASGEVITGGMILPLMTVLRTYDEMADRKERIPLGGKKGSTRFVDAITNAAKVVSGIEGFPSLPNMDRKNWKFPIGNRAARKAYLEELTKAYEEYF
jgi:hypothetical protein